MCAALSEKIAITGANGFVGRALVMACAAQNARDVLALTRRPVEFALPRVENFCLQNQSPVLEGVHVLVHVAARVHVMHDDSADPMAEFRAVNVQATLELARNAVAARVKRFIFISTAKVNGEATVAGKPFAESDPPNPQDPYSLSKWEAEQGLMQIARDTSMEVVIIRPPLIYGPDVKANFASLMRAVQRGIPLPLGAIHNARSLVGLDNLVDFIITCISHPEAANQTFLVSDGHDISTSQLVHAMAHIAGVPDRQFAVPVAWLQRLAKIAGKAAAVDRLCGNLQLDISKARRLLSWTPPVAFEDGLRRAMFSSQMSTAL